MKPLQPLFLSILVVTSVLVLAGCGISKEEHEKAVSELGKVKTELEKSVAELKKVKADLAQAVSKNEGLEKALSDAQTQIKSASKGSVDVMSTAAQDKLAAAHKQVNDLQEQVRSLSRENGNLKVMLDKIQTEYAEIQKKLGGGIQAPTQQLPAGIPKKQ